MPLVSVIIPSFNRAHTLERAIRSVLSQSFDDLECIVVDDGSTDETKSLVKKIKLLDHRVLYVQSENQGVSAARNLGFSHSNGKWIALLDSDDEWLEDKLRLQIDFALGDPKVPLIHTEEIWIRNAKRVNPKSKYKKEGGKIFERCLKLCLISPSTVLMKRSLYEEMGGFREDFIVCEDYELWLRITHKYEVGFIEEPLIIKYGGHTDQLSTQYKAMDYWRVKAMDEIFENPNYQLSQNQIIELSKEIVCKSDILTQGYIKHENITNLPFVKTLVAKYKCFF